MADIELLRQVVPDEDGWYCVIGLSPGRLPEQSHHKTLEEAQAQAEELVRQKYNVYFACGKFKTDENREAANCGSMKSFFLDIDCGEEKAKPDKHGRIRGYIDQATGMQALQALCKALKLPRPTIVDSGRGWHVYWPLTESVPTEKWRDVANTFKARCIEHKFILDPVVNANAAQVLRIPGTLNFKEDPPLPVQVMHVAPPMSFDEFAALMGPIIPHKGNPAPKQLDEFTKAMLGNRQSRFKTILIKTAEGSGCEQLGRLAENQADVEEPLWRAGLSVAQHCVDKDVAIHMISDQHPQYNRDKTVAKAEAIKGPYTCERFNEIAPGICPSCQHWEKIKSPIVIGHEIAEAEPNAVIVEETKGGQEEFVVPTLPNGYFRGKTGGIYFRMQKEDDDVEGEPKVVTVYPYDLFVVKRMYDPGAGETILVRLSLPRDGSKQFSLTLVDLTSKDELRKVLSFHGIIALKSQMEQILYYIAACAKELQIVQEVETMRLQFGWADDDSRFIVGDREIGPGFMRYSPPSKATQEVAAAMRPMGTFDAWRNIINLYGMPGFEPHAFAVFSAFGSPLLKFMGVKGSIINLVNKRSGTGKSTILQVMNSVWGHPDELMLQWKDTMNVKLHRMAVMCNLPLGVDEITKMSGDDFSDLAYSVTQGAPRRRMKASVNEEREAMGHWATIMVCTSNADMVDKLENLKATAEGELMRMMQYRIDPTNNISKHEAKRLFGRLLGNYGHAGPMYAQWLVQNLEEAIDFAHKVQAKIDEATSLESRERFWSATAAANIAGGMLARNLGIHDIDTSRIFRWVVNEIGTMRDAVRKNYDDYATIIGEFLLRHTTNTLVANRHSTSKAGIAAAPIVVPRGALVIRFEPDTKRVFIISSALKQFCVDKQITYNEMLSALNQTGAFIGHVRTRLDVGMDMQAPPVDALEFDADALGVEPSTDEANAD
jgi:hypothetical protein